MTKRAIVLAIPLVAVALHAAQAQMPNAVTAPMHHPSAHGILDTTKDGMQHGPRTVSSPIMPGQDAFGTVQEIVQILETDPKTDWSKIDLEALRQHLIDMNDVTLKSDAKILPVENGISATITETGRTVGAIQRMVPAHANELGNMNGWTAKAEIVPAGVRLTVTASDPAQTIRIRGLGFIGLMVSGAHHQPHHLAIAKGEFAAVHNQHSR